MYQKPWPKARLASSKKMYCTIQNMNKTPTTETYGSLQHAYDFFNKHLFDEKLPPCLLTLQRRSKRTYGFFSPNKFENAELESSDELAMNPMHFGNRELIDVLSTLAHEQTHVFQDKFGKPSRRGYHNKEWGRVMIRVGLQPSNTGKPGGKAVGQQMTHYVIAGGPFEKACAKLIASGFALNWSEANSKIEPTPGEPEDDQKPDSSNRVKFWCGQCGAKAWGKPSLKLICGHCRVDMGSKSLHRPAAQKTNAS